MKASVIKQFSERLVHEVISRRRDRLVKLAERDIAGIEGIAPANVEIRQEIDKSDQQIVEMKGLYEEFVRDLAKIEKNPAWGHLHQADVSKYSSMLLSIFFKLLERELKADSSWTLVVSDKLISLPMQISSIQGDFAGPGVYGFDPTKLRDRDPIGRAHEIYAVIGIDNNDTNKTWAQTAGPAMAQTKYPPLTAVETFWVLTEHPEHADRGVVVPNSVYGDDSQVLVFRRSHKDKGALAAYVESLDADLSGCMYYSGRIVAP